MKISAFKIHLLPSFSIDFETTLTTETMRQADIAFEKMRSDLKGYKLEQKRSFFRTLFKTAKVASWHKGCIRYTRRKSHPDYSSIQLQVIDAAVQAGLFHEYRSKPMENRMSRLIPTEEIQDNMQADPWTHDPNKQKQLVFLRKRGKQKEEIPFDASNSVAVGMQTRLERINFIVNEFEIACQMYDEWERKFTDVRRLRPVHYALFLEDFNHHGRIYTGKYGHQSLRKIERQTISFCNEPCVELDYSGLHTRLLYHLEKIDYTKDPYTLWKETTPPMRLMAKVFVNALINAKSPKAAISACNRKMCIRTKEGKYKTGKALEDARRLYTAQMQTGLKFREMLPLAMDYHKRIACRFGCDMGIKLMRMDSMIALDILYHFASRCIPCLGCHDSFIVPVHAGVELQEVMLRVYEERIGFLPLVKQ